MTERSPTERSSLVDALVGLLVDRSRRISALIVVAYVSGIAGLALSFLGDAGDPTASYGVIGIVLMALSFVSLFVVSVTMLDLAPDDRR